jgi:ornithine cyclodeaminase
MDDLFLEQPGKSDVAEGFLLRAAWLKNQALGVILATLFPDNHNAGLPSVQGAYVLFDGTNGTPQAVIDGTRWNGGLSSSASELCASPCS